MKEVDFSGLYGQKQVKERLKFYHKAFCATSETPFLAFIGGAGSGKTEFAKKLRITRRSSMGYTLSILRAKR